MKVLKMVRRLALVLLVICAGFCLVVGVKGYRMYKGALAQTSLADKVDSIRAREDYTSFEELPPIYVEAVLSVEDHRFYSHPGIDPIAIGRAVFNDLKAMAFVEGGSTITQQLAKNLYFSQEKELTRKAAEMFMAFNLERNYSKEDILELYVNSIYFGNGYYSVAEASEGYFGKAPSEMTEYESTLLAGIPNAPSVYALTANPDLAAQRQRQVVDRMVTCGYYTEVQAQETLAAGM
ncbi:glycosyl transferase [Enterocloster lavalensis]|nr:biosynthetic peptidoglycan transglycosylase [Enterocloster lavalensis]PST32095.1 glycosyl transferase [Enterocloster lavalensis]